MSDFHSIARAVYATANGKKFVDYVCEILCGENSDPALTDALKLAEAVGRQNVGRAIRRACAGGVATAVIRGKRVAVKVER